jgi:hypothetical protein
MPQHLWLYEFTVLMLSARMQLRIVNGMIFFQDNDVVKAPLSRFQAENDLILARWPLLFRTRVKIDDETPPHCDFTDCISNETLNQQFPRTAILARYMCLTIQQSVVRQPGTYACDLQMWIAWNSAIIRLMMVPEHYAAAVALLAILHHHHWEIYSAWNSSSEIHPGKLK